MKMMWKAVAAFSIAMAGVGAASVPAQAQYYGGDRGWRGDRDGRWDNGRRDSRGWDARRHWRDDRRGWRGDYRYRPRCWTQWRYDRWRHRDVRVRICR